MPYCARLTYASTTTSEPSNIRQDLTDILDKARIYNLNHQIHGVLYYGNNYFFQCIEGRKTLIDELHQKIKKDPRHTDIVVLSYHEIEQTSFKDWEMKYVYHDQVVQQFFSQYQWEKFNPYALKDGLIDEFLALLIPHENMEAGKHELVEWHMVDHKKPLSHMRYISLAILLGGLLLLFWYLYTLVSPHP